MSAKPHPSDLPINVVEIDGACITHIILQEFSVQGILEQRNETRADYSGSNGVSCIMVDADIDNAFATVQLFNSDGEGITYVGKLSDFTHDLTDLK
jgi:hypothetical protein